jgi:hypothetical protein
LVIFEVGAHLMPRLARTMMLLFVLPSELGWQVYATMPVIGWDGVLWTFLLGLSLNYNLPNLWLPNSLDYRLELLLWVYFISFYCWIIFHFLYVSHFIYSPISR